MDNSLLSLIDSAASILIVLPTKPYFDQVAAGLALYLSIHDRKDVSIYCPSPMTVGFNRLIGVNKIMTEIGNKNLTIKFINYEATNIDKVGYDIDKGEFKLTVTPKTGLAAPQKNQIVMDYAGGGADLVILIGGASDIHFPAVNTPELSNAKIVHIGTRVLDSKRGIMSLANAASTTSELVTNLIKENNLSFDADVATNLVMGIEEGTSNFAGSEVTAETFETFAYLLKNGGQRMPRVKLSPSNFPAGAIPGKPYLPKQTSASQKTTVPREETQIQNMEQASEQIENKEEVVENPPDDWLQPKIFKGTSIS